MKRLLICLLLLLNPYIFAEVPAAKGEPSLPQEFLEELKKAEEKEPIKFSEEFSKMLFYLGLLIGLLFVVLWFVKKIQVDRGIKLNESSLVRILETRPLSHKSILYLVDIEENTYLIAESHNGVTLLGKIDEKLRNS